MPILLGMLLRCFTPGSTTTSDATLSLTCLLIAFDWTKLIVANNKLYSLTHLGGRIRVALSTLIYRKVHWRELD